MHNMDRRAVEIGRQRRTLVTRGDLLSAGGTDPLIKHRVTNQRLTPLHAGVYTVGIAALEWRDRLIAACLAAGDGSAVSHRAALVLWKLDGLGSAPVEITVPYIHNPVPAGVIVHRTRRAVDTAVVDDATVTCIERTILDCASCLPPVVVEKAMESAFRRGLTTPAALDRYVRERGGRGVRGARMVRTLLADRPEGRAAGSGAEVEFIRLVRAAGIEAPVPQHQLTLRDGTVAVLDHAWPRRAKAVEVDGLDAHASAQQLDADLQRQNLILEAGWDLRRYSARRVRRHPESVAASVIRFLRTPVL